MDVVKAHILKGHPNRPGTKLSALKGIVIHYTQNEHPTATDTAGVRYIGRKYVVKEDKRYEADGETPFRFGSAHVFCDMDSITEAIPLYEVAWGCGDKNYKGGYQRVAEKVFKRRQNFETVSVEICNNDVIKNSSEDWDKAVTNALLWTAAFIHECNLQVDVNASLKPQLVNEPLESGKILLLRHYDITGKICPKPLVDDPAAWEKFVREVARLVDNYAIAGRTNPESFITEPEEWEKFAREIVRQAKDYVS